MALGIFEISPTPTAEEKEAARRADEAATKLQAARRGMNTRKRNWADKQLEKQNLGPIAVPTAEGEGGYPLYCIPVAKFLELDQWVPHQEALADGLLVEYDPATMDQKLLFISHQWTSWYHPDPAGEQIRALKYSLNKLIEGKTDVKSNAALEMNYGLYINHTGDWWKQQLPGMFLWIDYFSMPQPLATKFKGMSSQEIEAAMSEEKRARHAGMVATEGTEGSDGTEKKTLRPRHAGMDHRLQEAKDAEVAKLVGQLTKAVDCIPNYIQECEMMWVLVPPVKHADVDGAICDFATWRNRGWCRMEFKASKLKCGKDMPCMVIGGQTAVPFYVNPCDSPKLNPQTGDFSVEDDREKVMEVLNKFYGMKAQSYLGMGDLPLFRLTKLFKAVTTDPYHYTDQEKAVDGATAIARVKAALAWRDEATEEAWMKKYKLSLLHLAVMMNDEVAVKALLAQPDAAKSLTMPAKALWTAKEKAKQPHRNDPFVGMVDNIKGATPLASAIALCSLPVLELLIAARPPAPKGMQMGYMLGIMLGKFDNLKKFVDAYPECKVFDKPIFAGMTWGTMYAMMGSGPNQPANLNWLNSRTEYKFVNSRVPVMGITALHGCGQNTETDAKLVRDLASKGADINAKDKTWKSVVRLQKVGASLGIKKFKAFGRMLETIHLGATPLHHAAMKGNLEVVGELVRLGANVNAKDRFGKTPLERAAEGIPGNPPGTGITPLANTPTYEVLKELLVSRGYSAPEPSNATRLFA